MKSLISTSANLLNIKDVKAYLTELGATLTSNPKLKQWVTSNVYNYIVKSSKIEDPLGFELHMYMDYRNSDPDWLRQGIKEGKTFYNVEFLPVFKQNLEHAMLYLDTVSSPARVTFPDAVKAGNALIRATNKKVTGSKGKDLDALLTFSNGYKWVQLGASDLALEGKLMRNCVGASSVYRDGVKAKRIRIFSLRDKQNHPWCTIEYSVRSKTIVQIKGPDNLPISGDVANMCRKFLSMLKKQNLVETIDQDDLLAAGILEQDGEWYDVYNLPNNFRCKTTLNLTNTSVNYLPPGLTVAGSLLLPKLDPPTGVPRLTVLPEGLVVKLSLVVTAYIEQITSLLCGGTVDLLDASALKTLPNRFSANSLVVGPYLRELPAELKVAGVLNLFNCTGRSLVIPDTSVVTRILMSQRSNVVIPKKLRPYVTYVD